MEAVHYFQILVEQLHSTVVATVDGAGRPVTCVIDMMDWDEDGIYFLTARGKRFYDRLKSRGALALTGMKGADTLSSVSLSVCGRVRELGPARLPQLLEKNPYMKAIYPGEASRAALTVFQIYEGTGEWFDLSKIPVERASFTFGGAAADGGGYFITDACNGCRRCGPACPQQCIDFSAAPAVIRQQNCLRCGNCLQSCPRRAVVRADATQG